MQPFRHIAIAAVLTGLFSGAALASDMEGRGRVMNTDGGWCWFSQTVEKKTAAFIGSSPGQVATMSFDDPGCMAEITADGFDLAADFNRNRIADRIAGVVRGTWVTEDAVYDPKSRHQPGMLQKSGECMVAEGMPATAIAINFVSNGTSITEVEYSHVFGCGEVL